ncbi:hypothetical protein GCM10010387_04620 [Streptomyces inusitatus]|uniref:Uncharacterized protein n=1 Tax=Streptomyces inusitatus TaxID=68221 RepID=A0A918PN54_9ACTN|nr:hypothetical protein [Streptomyces inusitatus]GGZ15372.1 hypothetical protein GCM10010387_04620 [Streptomyces inusitatus]
MSNINKEIREYTGSKEFLDKVRADLFLNSDADKKSENQDFISSLKASMGIESLSSKVTKLDKEVNKPKEDFPVEAFEHKAEHGEGKYEAVGNVGTAYGATGALNGGTAELTGVSAAVKLYSFDYNIINEIQDRRARRNPERLRSDLDKAQADIVSNRNAITRDRGVTNRAHTRITDLAREMNRKLGLKADKTAMRNTDAQRTPQIRSIRRTADEASTSIDLLTRRLRDLGIAI